MNMLSLDLIESSRPSINKIIILLANREESFSGLEKQSAYFLRRKEFVPHDTNRQRQTFSKIHVNVKFDVTTHNSLLLGFWQ